MMQEDGKCMGCGEYYTEGEGGGDGLCAVCWLATGGNGKSPSREPDWPEEQEVE